MVGVQDPVEVINEALDRLADEDRSNWSVAAKTQRTVEITKLGARLEALNAICVGEWEAAGGWQVGGSRSPAAALAWLGGRSHGVAQKFVQTGRLVQRHPATAKSLANEDLKIDLAHQLGRAVTDKREPVYEQDEHVLLDAARRLDAKRFKLLIDRWVEKADDEVDPDKEFERFDRRELKIGQLLDGLSDVRGTFEAEGTALLKKVLDAYRKPDPAGMIGGRRSNAQTNYDALMAALAAAVDGKDGRPLRTTDAVVSYEFLARLPVTDLENMRCDLIGAGPVPPSLLRPWRRTPPSAGSSPTPTPSPSSWAPRSGTSPPNNAGPCASGTRPVSGPAVTCPGSGPRWTTPSTPPSTAPPMSATAASSASATTTSATKAGTSSMTP